MEALVLAIAAALFAGASSTCLVWSAFGSMGPVRSGSTQGLVEKDGRLAWLLRHGIRPLFPLADLVLHASKAKELMEDGVSILARHGYSASAQTVSTIALFACMVVLAVAWAVSGAFLTGVLVALCVVVMASVWIRSVEEKETRAVWEQSPEIIRSMSACLAAGLSLEQTFEQLEKESQGVLKVVFKRMVGVLKTGGTADQALKELKSCKFVPELAFVAVALDVHHQTGGSLRQVLESARDMVEDELELRRSLRVQTAQAKLSARIVTVMPFLLVTLFSLTSEEFLSPFFESVPGIALLVLAVLMQVTGVLLVRRLLDVQE